MVIKSNARKSTVKSAKLKEAAKPPNAATRHDARQKLKEALFSGLANPEAMDGFHAAMAAPIFSTAFLVMSGREMLVFIWFAVMRQMASPKINLSWINASIEDLQKDTGYDAKVQMRVINALIEKGLLERKHKDARIFRVNPALIWRGKLEMFKKDRNSATPLGSDVNPNKEARDYYRRIVEAANTYRKLSGS